VSTIVSYLGERVPVAIFGPAIVLTAALALWAAAPVDVGPAAIRAIVLAALIIVQLARRTTSRTGRQTPRRTQTVSSSRVPSGPVRAGMGAGFPSGLVVIGAGA
jgi:hypothetical protein